MDTTQLIVRRVFFWLLTAFSVYIIVISLIHSWFSPPPQTRFDRLQTDLVIEAIANDRAVGLLGEKRISEFYQEALTDYLKVSNQQEVAVQVGLLQVQSGDRNGAFRTWQNANNPITNLLLELWQEPPLASPESEVLIKQNTRGWFYFTALEKFYTVTHPNFLSTLRLQQMAESEGALFRLLVINAIPLMGSLIGVIILIFYWLRLRSTETNSWNIDWDSMTTLEVMSGWFCSYFILSQIISIPLQRIESSVNSPVGKALVIAISYITSMLPMLPILYFALPKTVNLKNWLKFELGNWRWLAWGTGGYCVAIPLVVLTAILEQFLIKGHGGGNPLLVIITESQNKFSIAILWFTLTIAAPFFEELLFRGFLLTSLQKYLPHRRAIAVSGFCFALAHLNISDLPQLTVLGIVLGIVYSRTRNLYAPFLLHGLWNTGSFISLLLLTD